MNALITPPGKPPDREDIVRIEKHLPTVFMPASPISTPELLKGRDNVIEDVRRGYRRIGSSIVMFGDRGVGKTSVAKVVSKLIPGQHFYYSASAEDTFESICLAILSNADAHWSTSSRSTIETAKKGAKVSIPFASGGLGHERAKTVDETTIGGPKLSSQEVATRLPRQENMIIIDDFERIKRKTTRAQFADLIKKLSDNEVPSTIMIVGIGSNIDELLSSHESARRSIIEIKVRRLEEGAIREIITDGMTSLGVTVQNDYVDQIVSFSARFPYYTHLLCEGAVTHLIGELRSGNRTSIVITSEELSAAIAFAIRNAEHSIARLYKTAIRSIRETQRFKYTLYAIASSPNEPVPYREITEWVGGVAGIDGQPVNVSHQLKMLTSSGIIDRVSHGMYHFRDPILKAFVILNARADSPAYELQAIDAQIKDTQKRIDRVKKRIVP